MKQQLLCTFTYIDKLTVSISQIYKAYSVDDVSSMKIYSYVETPNNVICVYGVNTSERRLKDTISINRKKESNTYYSINALNNLIRVLNNGLVDKSYKIEWSNYQNTLLLSEGSVSYKTIKIKEILA